MELRNRAGNVKLKLAECETPKALPLDGGGLGGGDARPDRGSRDANLAASVHSRAQNENEASPQGKKPACWGSGVLLCGAFAAAPAPPPQPSPIKGEGRR